MEIAQSASGWFWKRSWYQFSSKGVEPLPPTSRSG